MPLLLRTVDPTHVSRGTLPDRFPVQNDLEAVSNGTLSNVIRQLSALSHHADELFTDLIGVASGIAHRAGNLQARIDRLAVRVGQIDAVQEESASIHESLNTKPFTSSLVFDQQVVSRNTLPPSMLKTFQSCDMPPPLDKLNKYRDDGRNGLKFYTDPSYFFDLWRQEMLKDTERAIDRGKKDSEPHKLKHDGQNRHKKRVRQPHNTRERQKQIALQQGEHFIGSGSPDLRNQTNSSMESHDGSYQASPDPRASYAIGRGPSMELEDPSQQMNNRSMSSLQQQQQQRQQYEAYQRYYASHNQNYESASYNNRNNRNTPVNGYRPSQPPPAPPPNYIMGTPPPQGIPSSMHTPPNNLNNVNRMSSASRSNHRETLPPPPPPPTEVNNMMSMNMFPHPPEEEDLPPPPPTPLEHSMLRPPSLPEEHLPPSPPPPPLDETPSQAPPPPPPPPPGYTNIPQMAQNGDAGMTARNIATPKVKNIVSAELDGRNELLKAIRDGISLRRVETNGVKVEEKPSTYHDVASILARRVAVEMSDSDSGSSEYDSDGWDEASA